MTLPRTSLSDPTDLDGLRRFLKAQDPDERLSPLEMLRVEISQDAHLRLSGAVAEALAHAKKTGPAKIVIFADKTPIRRNGDLLRDSAKRQCADHRVETVVLDDGHVTLHADEHTLDKAAQAVAGFDLVITIGSGTMTDIGKVATHRSGGMPHIALQTAASVDGFTDNVSVVLRNGVKRTIASSWPTIVLADTATIGEAPTELNTSGFGEAISLFTAPADWYLANLVGLDSTFHPASMELLKAAAAEPPSWSSGVAKGEPLAIQKLTRLLALRGIVSGVSNTTACLSGVEHVVSHMLDLHHAAHRQPVGFHGAQVGVASLIASKLWRRAIATEMVNPDLLRKPDRQVLKNRVEKAFGGLGSQIANECWRDCEKKLELITTNWAKLTFVAGNWRQHCAEFRKMVQPAETLRAALRASGAPATFADLKPSVSPKLTRWAVANCHLMRNRFNLVDLLDLIGLWNDEMIDWALAE